MKNWPLEWVRVCTVVVKKNFPPVDTFNNPPLFLWYIDVDVNNPTKTMDPAA